LDGCDDEGPRLDLKPKIVRVERTREVRDLDRDRPVNYIFLAISYMIRVVRIVKKEDRRINIFFYYLLMV
jgi:hypothetical protein